MKFIIALNGVDINFIRLKYLHLLSPPYLASTLGCKGCYILGCFVGYFRIIQKFIKIIMSITHGKE